MARSTSSKPPRSPGQRRYEESNPWSLEAQHRDRFGWAHLTPKLQKTWEDAAAQAEAAQKDRRPLPFATPTPVSSAPAALPATQRERVRRIIQRG